MSDPTRGHAPPSLQTADPPLPGETHSINELTGDPAGTLGATVKPVAPPGYTLLDELGHGGMGVVYRARDQRLNRDVAVKFLHDKFSANSLAARRFVDEAKITGQLQHPGIPPVHEVGELSGGRPFIAMKLIKGRTLADILADHSMSRGALTAAFEQVCQAVAYAHNHGVIHRDLKPSNVMVGAFGEVQVMDWGLAKFRTDARADSVEASVASTFHDPRTDADEDLRTRAGSFLGTPAYMSPEQAIGAVDRIDERSDVFGLGGILCAILTGEPPFAGATPEATRQLAAQKQLDAAFARLDSCGAEPELVALCKRCLAGEQDTRLRNAGEVAMTVAGFRSEAEQRARQAELDRVRAEGARAKAEAEAREQRKRRRAQYVLAVTVIVIVVLVGGGAWYFDRQRAAVREERSIRDERVRVGVEQTLARLPELYRHGLWQQAEQSLAEADQHLGPDGDPQLKTRVAAARRDTALISRLNQIRLEKIQVVGGSIDREAASPKYKAVFAEYGFDITSGDPATLAKAISDSPIREYLVAALDDWGLNESDQLRRRIFALTAASTGHEWRRKLADASAHGPALVTLFASIPPDQRTPAVTAGISLQLDILGEDGLRPLDEGLRQHPGDMWLHFFRGLVFYRRWSRIAFNNLEDRNFQLAHEAFRTALAVRPGEPELLRLFAMTLPFRNEQAEAALAEALHRAPNYAQLHLALANRLRTQNPERALSAGREAVRLDPTLASAHKEIGLVLRLKGDLSGAEDSLRRAVQLAPGERFNRGDLGWVLVERKKYAEAIVQLREALRIDPRLDYARRNLQLAHIGFGESLRGAGGMERVLDGFEEAIPGTPERVDAYTSLGRHLLETRKDVDGAISCFEQAVSLDPKNAISHTELGVAQARAGGTRGAIASYRAAIRCDPKYEAAYYNLEHLLREQGAFEKAILVCRELLRHYPKSARAHLHIGLALRGKGELDAAVRVIREAILLEPGAVDAHIALGDTLIAKRDIDGAIDAFRGAVHVAPNHSFAYTRLGHTRLAKGDLNGALTACREAVRLNPRLAPAQNDLGAVLRARKDLPGAVLAFREAARLEPANPYRHEALGYTLELAGDLEGAIVAYREAVHLDPKNPGYAKSLEAALSMQAKRDSQLAPPPREVKRP